MAIPPLAPAGLSPAGSTGAPPARAAFGPTLRGQGAERAPIPVAPEAGPPSSGPAGAAPGLVRTASPGALPPLAPAAWTLGQLQAAQRRLDEVLRLAESGRCFSPAELLALQANVYRASQQLDLAGKVVEKATGGVKQVLQTQV
jgi:hypothetical protein